VEGEVLGDFLGQGGDVCENLSPVCDSCDVLIHVFAVVEGLGDLEGDYAELETGLDFPVFATVLEVLDCGFNLGNHEFGSIVALFDFHEIVVCGHSVHKASQNLGNGKQGDVGGDRKSLH